MNPVDRKIMLKMYDRERDYKWSYDISKDATKEWLTETIHMDQHRISKNIDISQFVATSQQNLGALGG